MLTLIDENGINSVDLQSIHERLDDIKLYLENEIALKQGVIDGQADQIRQLKAGFEKKEMIIQKMDEQLQDCKKTNDGTRQLINKLLNDISNYQKDIEWYKRTYEKRSLAGTIFQKLFKR
jgi:chromosome segregation ATPase